MAVQLRDWPVRRWLNRLARRRARNNWAALAGGRGSPRLSGAGQRRLRDEAITLRRNLDLFLMRSDPRLEMVRETLDALNLPIGTDWRWRPDFMAVPLRPSGIASPENAASLGGQAAVWHDCPERALILQQIPNLRATDLSPFALRMEVFGFAGSFLSVSVDLPESALQGLKQSHILRLETGLTIERGMNVFARLNIANGPNTDQITQTIEGLEPGRQDQQVIEFDLAYTEINENRLEKIWLDLIFESPGMNALEVRELFVSRHLRAEF